MEATPGHRQQVLVLAGNQRTDKVERAVGQSLEAVLAVVALVEDQRDVLAGLGQFLVMSRQLFGNGAELDTVGDIARINPVQEGNVEIRADQQAQAHLPEVAALLLVVAALGEFGRGAGVDVGEEIRAVVDQGAQVEVEALDQPLIHLLLKDGHVLGRDLVHMVPEVL